MSASALFAGLTQRECMEILSCARARTFARDEMLFTQGEPVRNLIMLRSGSVKLTQLSSGGKEALLWMTRTGDPVNPNAESASRSQTCSARAIDPGKALVWEFGRLQMLLAQHPQIRKDLDKILTERLKELEERFREMAIERVAKRLALALLRLLKQIGKPSTEGVDVCLSREELAQMTGTTLFTISRILSEWAEQGFVLPRREAVTVLDASRLEQVGDED
jgi:CRP-like cAMP-binding protein